MINNMKEYTGEKVTFLCTSACNINCSHCYVCYKGKRNPDELLELVKNLKDKYKIMLNGAEVLTDPEYLKSYKEIGQPWILSNGLALLKPNIIEKLKSNSITSVSMSYHFGIHDEISVVKYKQILEIIEILRANGLNYRFLTTITSKNYQLIEEMCKESYQLGAKGIMFTNFIRQGNGINLEELILTKQQLKEFFEYLKIVRSMYDKKNLIIERSGTFGMDETSSNNHFCCEFGDNRIYITPDNNVYPCIFLTKPGYEIGKLIDGKIMVEEKYENNHDKCLVSELCNNGIKLTKKINH